MPVNNSTLNKNLFDLLRSKGYDPVSLNSKGDPSEDIEEADVFRFNYISPEGEKVGTGWATIEGKELVIYTNRELVKAPKFEELAMFMKDWARRKLLGFKVTNKDFLVHDMKKRTVMKNKEDQLNEGYYALGKKASYNDSVPTVKMIIQHTRNLEEGEQRFRNIAKIFVENANGERFLLPTNRPGLARVYARHIAEGGTPYDDRAKHINTLVEEYTKMAGFVRATKNGQFNESAQRLVNEGVTHYQNLREALTRMASHRGYNKYFESYTPVLNEEADDESTLNELFVQETLDPRIESVMPILKRLQKNITEMNEVNELAEWAETISEVEDETTKTLAEPATKMLEGHDPVEGVKRAVMHRIMIQHPNLVKDLDELEMAVDDAARWFVGDGIEELGSSDISAIVKDVASRMSERGVQIDELSGDLLDRASKKAADKATQWDIRKHQVQNFLEPGEKDKDLVKKFGKAAQHYEKMSDKMAGHNEKMRSKLSKAKWASELPGKIKNLEIDEAPGAETLAHNQSTEKKNLKAFGLAEGFSSSEEVADQIVNSLGGETNLTSDDVYRAVEEYQSMMDSPHKLDTDEVVQIVMDRMNISDEVAEDLDANQKRVGQLGPTEPVGKNEKNLRNKFVGNESADSTEEAITEMDSPGPHDDPWAKGGKATPIKADKAKKDFAKILQKNIDKSNKAKHDTDKKVAQHQVKEGQDDLDAILRIVHK